ncbi:hypothetical protein IMY05_C4770000100 [Salix suchowensis]|nr:hypothetical protein IMY05_C4770000100 [Salix suchowensis]
MQKLILNPTTLQYKNGMQEELESHSSSLSMSCKSNLEEELSELDGEDLVESIEAERKRLGLPEPLAIIMESAGSVAVWAKAEKDRGLGYNRQSKCTQQHCVQKACKKAKIDKELQKTKYQCFPLKRCCLEVPAHVVKAKQKETRKKELAKAFSDIDKHLQSKKTVFHAGQTGLQAYQMRVVQSFLHMVINTGHGKMEAGAQAAESHGFTAKYGGRMVQTWAKRWVEKREVPTSD